VIIKVTFDLELWPWQLFLPDRTWLRYIQVFAVTNPSVVCNIRAPYSGIWNFPQYFFAVCTLAIRAKFYGDWPRGTPPSGN